MFVNYSVTLPFRVWCGQCCTCKSCISVRSLTLSAGRHWLSGLDADSLLSRQETKFERCFSYLKEINGNSGENLIYVSIYTVKAKGTYIIHHPHASKILVKWPVCSIALTFAKEKAGSPECSACPLTPVYSGRSWSSALSLSSRLVLCRWVCELQLTGTVRFPSASPDPDRRPGNINHKGQWLAQHMAQKRAKEQGKLLLFSKKHSERKR